MRVERDFTVSRRGAFTIAGACGIAWLLGLKTGLRLNRTPSQTPFITSIPPSENPYDSISVDPEGLKTREDFENFVRGYCRAIDAKHPPELAQADHRKGTIFIETSAFVNGPEQTRMSVQITRGIVPDEGLSNGRITYHPDQSGYIVSINTLPLGSSGQTHSYAGEVYFSDTMPPTEYFRRKDVEFSHEHLPLDQAGMRLYVQRLQTAMTWKLYISNYK